MKGRWIAIPLAFVAAVAMSHVYTVTEGVHFKAAYQPIDFGLPPSRRATTMYDLGTQYAWRPGTEYVQGTYTDRAWEAKERAREYRKREVPRLLRLAREAERHGRRDKALAAYRDLQRQGMGDAAFVRTRIDLFKELGGQTVPELAAYLDAVPLSPRARKALPETRTPILRPYVEYEAVTRAPATSPREAAERFLGIAHRYPRSSRAPACLIMAARALTQAPDAAKSTANLRLADFALRELLRRYPSSRFAWDARGGLGRIDYLRRRYAEAYRHYEIQVREAHNDAQRERALTSILICDRTRGRRDAMAGTYLRMLDQIAPKSFVLVRLEGLLDRFDAVDARRFGERLRRDPILLERYANYRMDFTKPTDDLFRFAHVPGITGRTLAQMASGALALKNGPRAERLARRALSLPNRSDSHPLATFVLATLDRRADRRQEARNRYREILRRWPAGYLAGGSRENLALLEERLDNLPGALDQYTALDYREDFAYMVDARMTSRQLAHYIDSRPEHPRRALMIYTLGLRYLREERWDAADWAFRRLTPRQRKALTAASEWVAQGGGLQDPVATLRALRRLDANVRRAKGQEAKAKALLTMGDYFYHHHDLLLYSPQLWKGVRTEAFAFSWNASVATPADDRALARHHEDHEAFAQALRRYRRVVRDYPRTKTAPVAAYWGACAANRLAHMAPYWRWYERKTDLLGESVRLMRFAERAQNPKLAAKARKYGKVFRIEREKARAAFGAEKPPRRRFSREY
jgi:outer membrane protein assembly factor BamD (BamD/ComL family)